MIVVDATPPGELVAELSANSGWALSPSAVDFDDYRAECAPALEHPRTVGTATVDAPNRVKSVPSPDTVLSFDGDSGADENRKDRPHDAARSAGGRHTAVLGKRKRPISDYRVPLMLGVQPPHRTRASHRGRR